MPFTNDTPPCPGVDLNCTEETNRALNESLWLNTLGVAPSALVATVYLLIFFVAFFANLFIIVFMIRKPKTLTKPSSIFLFCLAVIDFLEAVLSIPFYIVSLTAGGWIFGPTDAIRQTFCSIVGFCLSLFISLSIYTLGVISFDRYFYIRFALKYRTFLRPWTAWLLMAIVSLLPIGLSMAPFFGYGRFFYFQASAACLFKWRGENNYVIGFCLMMLIPANAILIFTGLTYWHVRRHFHRSLSRQRQWSTRETQSKVKADCQSRQKSLTRIFIALLIAQLVCFAPGLTIAFVGFFTGYEDVPNALLLITFFIIHCNAAVNPVIQSFFRKPIRDALFSTYRKFRMLVMPQSDSLETELTMTKVESCAGQKNCVLERKEREENEKEEDEREEGGQEEEKEKDVEKSEESDKDIEQGTNGKFNNVPCESPTKGMNKKAVSFQD